jgi:hypothetical protein
LESIADLISRDIAPEPGRVNAPAAHLIDTPLVVIGTETEPHAFEIAVFNFLLAHKELLGISAVWRCRNVRIDGLVDLTDGQRVALEIKYRMNWEKACQACAQFGWYRTHVEAKEKPLSGGLVVFEAFTGDWARSKSSWLLENGWSFFYTDHREVEGLRVDLLRVREGKFESFPSALAAAMEAGRPPAV